MPELGVVIPTFRRPAILRRALERLARQDVDRSRVEVIVVDNDPEGETSGAVAAVVDEVELDVRRLHQPAPGASAARNLGWRVSQAPAILFLGDDILAGPGMLAAHLAFHSEHPAGTAAALGDVRWSDEVPRTPLTVWLDQGAQSGYPRLRAGGTPTWGDFLTTHVSVKRRLLERAGGFDEERFPFLYEDTDLGLRLHRLGMRLHYLAAARAEHLHQQTLEDWRERMAEIARAERRWLAQHPDQEPYFATRMRTAVASPPARGRLARLLATRVPPGVPWLGERVHAHLDLAYRQALAPDFLAAWEDSA